TRGASLAHRAGAARSTGARAAGLMAAATALAGALGRAQPDRVCAGAGLGLGPRGRGCALRRAAALARARLVRRRRARPDRVGAVGTGFPLGGAGRSRPDAPRASALRFRALV